MLQWNQFNKWRKRKKTQTKTQPKPEVLPTSQELLTGMIEDYTGLKQKEIVDVRRGMLTRDAFLAHAREHLEKTYEGKAANQVIDETLREFEKYIFGYYRLQELLDDPEVSDIRIVREDCIRLKKQGKRLTSAIQFDSQEEYNHFVELATTKNQVNISNLNAIQTFTDDQTHPDFILRFTIVMPLLNSKNTPDVHIRKIAKNFPELDALERMGVVSAHMKEYLIERARTGSIFICGKSGSGKTILLNALKEAAVAPDKSCIVIQENGELTTKNHPEMLFLHPVVNRGESKITYSLDEISTAALLMDFDYFIIGEVKGAEALDLLNASYTGHICMATGHGESAEKALNKVMVNAKKKSDLPAEVLLQMLSTFQTIVFMKDFKVTEVSEVTGWSQETQQIQYQSIAVTEKG